MKRADYERILRDMEQTRHDGYEAPTARDEQRLIKRYARLAKIVEPYASGKRPFADEAPDLFEQRKEKR